MCDHRHTEVLRLAVHSVNYRLKHGEARDVERWNCFLKFFFDTSSDIPKLPER